MNDNTVLAIGMGILGLGFLWTAAVELSPRLDMKVIAWKRAHPRAFFLLTMSRFGNVEGILSDSELEAHGAFKKFVGVLCVVVALLFFIGAYAAANT